MKNLEFWRKKTLDLPKEQLTGQKSSFLFLHDEEKWGTRDDRDDNNNDTSDNQTCKINTRQEVHPIQPFFEEMTVWTWMVLVDNKFLIPLPLYHPVLTIVICES